MNNIMTYKGYSTSIEFDVDDHILVGRILDVDDIITFHSESVKGFEKAFHQAIDEYVAACEKIGQAPEKPASGRLMLRISPTVHAAALKAAGRSRQSLNKWAEQVLQKASHC